MTTKALNYLRRLMKGHAKAKNTVCERSVTEKTATIEDEKWPFDPDHTSLCNDEDNKSLGRPREGLLSERRDASALSCPDSCPDSAVMGQRSCVKKHGKPRRSSIQFRGEVELDLPGSHRPVKRRTSITFDKTVQVKKVPPVHELTQDLEDLWFQDEDYAKMRKRCFLVADAFASGDKVKGKLCIRGLESILYRETRSNAIEDGWDSVLDEQYMQREEGSFDDEYLGRVYRFATRESSMEAMKRAQQDELHVRKYLQGTRRLNIMGCSQGARRRDIVGC